MSEPPAGAEGGQGARDHRRSRSGPKGSRRPRQGPGGPPARRPGSRTSSLGLARVGGNEFELVHPRGVKEMELDYEEGIELWKAGDPESARDALRYALAACHDNLWIHTALGQIALEEFHDPSLARGHFAYAVELGRQALPQNFTGRLSPHRPANRPFFDAVEGLLRCLEALGRPEDVRDLRAMRERLSTGTS
jgi:hypothetical protein